MSYEQLGLLHVGAIAAILKPANGVIHQLVDQVRTAGIVSYDPNVRPHLIESPEESRRAIGALAAVSDIVKVSDEDLAWIDPASSEADIAQRWLEGGAAVVVITRGGEGATGIVRAGGVSVVAPTVSVVDTVGAGDTFMGALLARLIDLGLALRTTSDTPSARLRELDLETLESLLEHGVAAAAVSVSRAGANPPWKHELAGGGLLSE